MSVRTNTNNRVAIVLGGSTSVWAELEQARLLCIESSVIPVYFVCNDMIEHFDRSDECIAVALHADKLPNWLARRSLNGFASPTAIWTCTSEKNKGGAIFATNHTKDPGGSVGLFATQVAVSHYCLRVILCGVPLTQEGGHFVRNKAWTDAKIFERRWLPYLNTYKGCIRSFSGKTKEWFGMPTKEYIIGTKLNMEAKDSS